VNLDVGLRLAARLRSLGAIVMMTRTANAPVILYERPALAERLHADVLMSVHQNAAPDGSDPSREHGYSVYYFQPQSLALAQALHQAYHDEIGIPDEGLHSGDLALVRPSAMPAVLTESAFITWPWEEMLLRDPSFRERLAKAMADGMERWAERMREKESQREPHPTQV
jgi:N-acetylmuramoyl-L-alanine amidase